MDDIFLFLNTKGEQVDSAPGNSTDTDIKLIAVACMLHYQCDITVTKYGVYYDKVHYRERFNKLHWNQN